MSESETYPCPCGARVVVVFTMRASRAGIVAPPKPEIGEDGVDADDLLIEPDPMREFDVVNFLQLSRGLVHVDSGMVDMCRWHVLSLRDQLGAADLDTLRGLGDETQPAFSPCQCGATIRSAAATTFGPPADEPVSQFTSRSELVVTRTFAHQDVEMIDGCRKHLLALRNQLATADLERLGERAESLRRPAEEPAL
jgi:hypothetical protein